MPHTIIQLSAGQGPLECRKFIPLLADLIRNEAEQCRLELIGLGFFPENTEYPASGSFAVRGSVPEDFRIRWEGTVQWIWRSTVRPHHPRKNWFVKVSFRELPETGGGTVRPEDLRVETFRASGAGGQHVNRTDSAVRLIHLPTGIVCTASEERSQIRNRQLALLRLQARLQDRVLQSKAADISALRMEHYRLERGGAVRIFEGLPPKEKQR